MFDFDGAVFADLWQSRSRSDFETYVRYHLSDHRPHSAHGELTPSEFAKDWTTRYQSVLA